MNRQNRLLIVPAMMKKALALVLFTLVATPLLAQTTELGFSFGGGSRRTTSADQNADTHQTDSFSPLAKTDLWKLDDTVKEAYIAIQLEPGTRFKIKAGQMDTTTVFFDKDKAKRDGGDTGKSNFDNARRHFDGKLEHIDGIIDYRFSEPYGSTGLFAGVGMYRQTGGGFSETNVGAQAGVNADFPLSPRYGIVLEATYHFVRFDIDARYITGTAGLRISF